MMEMRVECPDLIKLEKTFQDLDYADKKKIINSAFRKAVKPTVEQAESNLAGFRKTGNLIQSVGSSMARGELAILVGARRSRGYKGYHGHLLEEGTVERFYTTKKGNIHKTGRMDVSKGYGHWLKRATETTGEQAFDIMVNEWHVAIDKYLRRHGLR